MISDHQAGIISDQAVDSDHSEGCQQLQRAAPLRRRQPYMVPLLMCSSLVAASAVAYLHVQHAAAASECMLSRTEVRCLGSFGSSRHYCLLQSNTALLPHDWPGISLTEGRAGQQAACMPGGCRWHCGGCHTAHASCAWCCVGQHRGDQHRPTLAQRL